MAISLIAAVDKNFLIGSKNALPWGRLPADMAHFKNLTMGKTVVMGRKTFESIGRALPGRRTIVLTRNHDFNANDVKAVHDTSDIFALNTPRTEIMIIGGAELYRIFLPCADRLYLTHIDAAFEGDTYFPLTDVLNWQKTEEHIRPPDERHPWQLRFATYRKETCSQDRTRVSSSCST